MKNLDTKSSEDLFKEFMSDGRNVTENVFFLKKLNCSYRIWLERIWTMMIPSFLSDPSVLFDFN